MKLNPFRKKTNRYVETTQAKFNELSHELDALNKEYATVKAELDRETAVRQRMDDRASHLALQPTAEQNSQWHIVMEVSRREQRLGDKVSSLEDKMKPLRRIIEAPKNFDDAQSALQNLLTERQRINQEIALLDATIGKINKRVTDVQAKIATETAAASKQMIAAEDDFVVPESLTRLELQVRLANTSLTDLQRQRTGLAEQLKEMPEQIRSAQRSFEFARAKLAEVDIYDQMLPFMKQLSRASVTRHQTGYHHEEATFKFEIPWDLINSTKAELAAELVD
jgi:chromosome segregation ATPase